MKRDSKKLLNIRVANKKAIASFRSKNRLTILNAETIRLGLLDIVTRRNFELEIDLKGIKFIDSSMIDVLNLMSRMAKRYNSRVYLTNTEPELLELIELVKMHSVFDIKLQKTEEEITQNVA